MGKQTKLPAVDFAKFGNALIRTEKDAGKFVSDHAPKFLAGALSVITIDSIRMRICRKMDQEAFKENTVKQQQIIRKHEAEINVLKGEAEQAQEAIQKVDKLTQIVNSMTEGGVSE